MPNLVLYVPMKLWKALEKSEGQAAKKVARSVAKRALEQYVLTGSVPVGNAPSSPSLADPPATAAAGGAGADENVLEVEHNEQ
jgi:hypothetical protein